ncbi:MAG: hypothetical protein ABID61_06350 [Candidatus Micrarchaeota archaeon]
MQDAARTVDLRRRPFVPPVAAATKPKTEGLAIAIGPEEREKFVSAAKRYDNATPQTEDRFEAMREFLPFLRTMHRTLSLKAAERDATEEDRERHQRVMGKLREMIGEIRTGCESHRYEIRQLAFRMLSENGLIGEISNLARTNKHEDIRENAIAHLIDDIAKSMKDAVDPQTAHANRTYSVRGDGETSLVTIGTRPNSSDRKQAQLVVSRKKDGLLDVGINAIYSDVRQRVAEYLANANDSHRLQRMKTETRYMDTKILITDLAKAMHSERADTVALVEACIQEYFGSGGETPPPVANTGKILQFARKPADPEVPLELLFRDGRQQEQRVA